jgi:hypothetical protein
MPALMINPSSGVFIGDLFGFLLALPVVLFLAYWLSAVEKRILVVIGAFIGALIGFLAVLAWVGTLIYDTELPGANGVNTFFGSLFICSIAGLDAAIITDLIIARLTRRSYRRSWHLVRE